MGFRDYLGKNELFAVSLMALLIAVVLSVILFMSDAILSTHYDSISVGYNVKGSYVSINEELSLSVAGRYHVLYRSFSARICLGLDGNNCNIIIDSVSCGSGKPYFSKDRGHPVNPSTGKEYDLSSFIKGKVRENEVGCILESGYMGKKEKIKISYRVLYSYVKSNRFNHYFFTNSHPFINYMKIRTLSGKTVTTDSIPKDKRVSININNGKVSTIQVNMTLVWIVFLLICALPFIIWKFLGTEKAFVVPEYLHTIPDRTMKYWQVDVLTNGTGKLSKNGLAAMLFNLYIKPRRADFINNIINF